MAKNTYIPRNEVIDMHKEFNKVRKKAVEELMKYPGVIAVGVGLKQVKGEMQRELCFKVTVTSKVPKSEIKPKDRIPKEIYGFKTDVNEIAITIPSADESGYRPLMGGSQLESSGQSEYGTLGCFASRNTDGKIVLLSNWHVLVDNPDNIDGDRAGQPTHNGCCTCCACNEIGKTVDGRFRTGNIDAAIALLHGQDSDIIPDYRYLNEILEVGIIAGSATPFSGETVWKRGRTTFLTKGQISNDHAVSSTIYKNYGGLAIPRTGLFEITPQPPFADFTLPGDSGSVSVNEHHQVVLLNFAASNTHLSYSNNIDLVTAALGITIIDSTFHTTSAGNEGVPLRSSAPVFVVPNLAGALEEIETELNQFNDSRHLLDLFKKHREELLDLVNHKREVMAAWNRYEGPAYLANIARSIRRENKPLPEQIHGITLQNLLLKMTAVLQRNGSPELVKAVTDNYLRVMNVLSSGRRPEEWKAYLAQTDGIMHAKL